MNADPVIPDEEDGDYELVETTPPITLCDGDCTILNPDEFAELFEAHAVILRDGALFVLRKDTLEWLKVEPLKPAAKPRPLKTVQ